MRTWLTNGSGWEGLQLVDRPEPGPPGPGEVLIAVRAVALNYRDLLVVRGQYGWRADHPFIPASDMAGEVLAVGPGVTEFKPGDRVVNAPFRCWPAGQLTPAWSETFIGGSGVDGVLTERIVYPAMSLTRMPEHMDFRQGATLTIAGLTAWSAVVSRGRVRPGEWVLLYGTGGVSIFAAQLARLAGARVVLLTSSEKKGAAVRDRLGIESTLNYRDSGWLEAFRELTGGHGADLVVDVVGGNTLDRSIEAAAFHGRISLIGVLEGLEAHIRSVHILRKQISILGIFMESAQELRHFAAACESARLIPWIDRIFPFEQAREAWAWLAGQQHIGKVVIDGPTA